MANSLTINLELPGDLAKLKLPKAVESRLHELLDRQDEGPPLSPIEREEAQGLVDVSEMLTVLRLRAERAEQAKQ
jgi:hypothetical protein